MQESPFCGFVNFLIKFLAFSCLMCYKGVVRVIHYHKMIFSQKINNSEVGFYASSVRRLGSRRETKRRVFTRSYDILSAPVATDEYTSCVEKSGFISSLDIIYFRNLFLTHFYGGVFLCNSFLRMLSLFVNSLTISEKFKASVSAVSL